MSGIITAVVGTAVVGDVISSSNASKVANAQTDATNASIAANQAALTQQQKLAQPYVDAGTKNLPTYQNLLSGGTSAQQTLESLPGYKATLDTGIESAKRSAASSGLNLSGNQLAGVESFGATLADQTYQQQLDNLLQPIQLGQAAAAGQAANIGANVGANNALTLNNANTQSAISTNEAAGISKSIGNVGNQLLTYNTLNNLNNPGGAPGASPTYGGVDPSAAVTGIGGTVGGTGPLIST